VEEGDPGAAGQHLHRELVLGARAAGGIGERRVGAAGQVHELREAAGGQARVHGEEELVRGDARHGDEVGGDVHRRALVDPGVHGEDRVLREEEGVAVGAGAGRGLRGDEAVGAGAVLDDDGLAKALGQRLGEDARGDVRGAAGGNGGDEADGAVGVGGLGATAVGSGGAAARRTRVRRCIAILPARCPRPGTRTGRIAPGRGGATGVLERCGEGAP
jgi:hypothetical protein